MRAAQVARVEVGKGREAKVARVVGGRGQVVQGGAGRRGLQVGKWFERSLFEHQHAS